MRTVRRWPILFAALVAWLATGPLARAADAPAKVYVILWFDTEDYILPASDDAALHVADWLSREGIRATFKVVGEKARTLERRGRSDVIAALKKHEIGYHSNYHSTQPSPAMYLSTLGWDEGVAEFDRRERAGVEDVARIFGQRPTCYGQPGSSWAPQTYGAMRDWGMKVYLDSGSHVALDGKPHYYGGLLTLYKLTYVLRTRLGGAEDLKEAEDRFVAAREKLRAEGGGIVSIYYHPCEFVQKEFWDGVNFRRGANPPRDQWQLPPAKTPEESRAAYENFEGYVRFIKRFGDVRFITAGEAAELYRDDAQGRSFDAKTLRAIADAVGTDVSFQKRGDYALTASEVFTLLNDALRAGGSDAVTLRGTPDGPSNPMPPLTEPVSTDWSQFTRTAADVADYLGRHKRVPTTVWLGSTPVSPESYLAALARVVRDRADGKPPPDRVEVPPARLAAARFVAADDPKLWGWVIFPPNFRAPAMMELAKRQAWTLKPARLHPAAKP
jgi:peptidoglycan/xylan/chitin deacetylase (PgdA/CDA1 family)